MSLKKIKRNRISSLGQIIQLHQQSFNFYQKTVTLSADNTTIQVGNLVDNLYGIQAGIGTPPQYFIFHLDTGSNTNWIPLINYVGYGFNSNQSSTFTITNTQELIIYGDGSHVLGNLGTDIFSINNTQIYVKNQMLWVISESKGVQPKPVTGLIGLGNTDDPPNFLDLAYQAEQIQTSIFSLQLAPNQTQSIMYYNQIPQEIKNRTIMVPVSGSKYWQVLVISFISGDHDFTQYSSSNAIIDSGTSLLQFNAQLYQQIKNKYFFSCQIHLGIPICPCNQAQQIWPQFSITLQGVKVFIYPQNYTQYVSYNGQINCTYRIGTLGSSFPSIILGDVFFRNYIITFDKKNQQIGFYGDLAPVQMIGAEFFAVSQYIMLGILIFMSFLSLLLFYQLKLYKNKGNKQFNLYMLQI